MTTTDKWWAHPLARRLWWVLFAILFYNSGLAFTTWLLDRAAFGGGLDWLWLGLFPLLLPTFFLVGRHLGCASGRCNNGQCTISPKESPQEDSFPNRMPGI